MRLDKLLLIMIVFIVLTSSSHAQVSYTSRHLTGQEIQRVRDFKELLDGVDKKSLWDTIHELEKSRHPQLNLEVKEAMARTYTDLVKDYDVKGQKKKEWLYSMICLNMAYLQFSAGQNASGNTTDLNKLIRQKLKKYLPPDIIKQPGFVYSLD